MRRDILRPFRANQERSGGMESLRTANRRGDAIGGAATGRSGRWLAALGPLLAVMLCAGCGWQPLYARPSPDPTSGGVESKLAQISIDPVTTRTSPDPLTGDAKYLYDGRAAQLLENNLRNDLNPYGPPSDASYHLAVELSQLTRASASLGNGDETREDLVMTVKYQLSDEKGASVLIDTTHIVTSYDILREPFSDLSSQNDAMQRGTQQLAQEIQTRISVFLQR